MTAHQPPSSVIRSIGIIGEGKMGSNIFYYLLDFDYRLVWICHPETDPESIRKSFQKKMKRKLEAGILTEGQFRLRHSTVNITRELEAVSACDLIIEAIPEVIEQKLELFSLLDKILPQEGILTSNSSSINPSRLIPSEQRKRSFAGLHFFYPVNLKNIVEIIFPETSSEETRKKIIHFLEHIHRKFLVLDELHSFILNRIFLDFQNEAFQLVKAGHITVRQLDELVRNHFFPFGVFDFMDSVGLDTMLSAINNYTFNYPHRDYYLPLIHELEEKIRTRHLGQKSGQGFYPMLHDQENPDIDSEGIIHHLRQTFFSSAKRFSMRSGCSIEEMNEALKEYFELEKGLFEL